MEYIEIIIVAAIALENFIIIILLAVQNGLLKKSVKQGMTVASSKGNTASVSMPQVSSAQISSAQVNQVQRTGMTNTTYGIMICRKCYNPVSLKTKKCAYCGQGLIIK